MQVRFLSLPLTNRSIIFSKIVRTILYNGMREQILKLRSEGKTYKEIQLVLGCSKSLVSYHCGNGQKKKTLDRQRTNRKDNCLLHKVDSFKHPSADRHNRRKKVVASNPTKLLRHKSDDFQRRDNRNVTQRNITFSYKDVLEKFGDNPTCYLTGRTVDMKQPRTYHFDHIVPASRGGKNTLDNLGIACKAANKAKDELLVPELLELCKEILIHHGYEVTKR